MLLNRLIERGRSLGFGRVLLSRRARRVRERAPVVLVPGMFGTRIVDGRGRTLWGSTLRLYGGPSITGAEDARPAGILADLSLVPGLVGIDVYGGLVRFLEDVGGYRRGEDLRVLDYDWRAGAVAGAERLADLCERIRGAGEERVDVIGISTGGQLVRWFVAHGGDRAVRRAIYVGTPQRGTFDALACMHRGFRFAPGGKLFTPGEAAACQTTFDALPHPADRVLVDQSGAPLDLDLYDASVWARLGLVGEATPDFQARLDRARAFWQALDRAPHGADAVVIGAGHLPTPARAVVIDGEARVPPPSPRPDDPYVGYTYAPGDGELSLASLRALPGLDPRRLWLSCPPAHHRLPSDPGVHDRILEALLATDRHIPGTKLERSLPVIQPR